MILCLLGTSPCDFSRLIKPLDQLAEVIEEDFFIQLGHTRYIPRYCKYNKFIDKKILYEYMTKAELIISHGGFGSLTDAICLEKKVIAIPRYVYLEETQADQVELVKYYAEKKYVVPCYNTNQLEKIVKKALADVYIFNTYQPQSTDLVKDLVFQYLQAES